MTTKANCKGLAASIWLTKPALADLVRIEHFDDKGQSLSVEYLQREQFAIAVGRPSVRPSKVAVLTGVGGKGIGEATARELVRRGFQIIASDRDEIGADTCRDIEQTGGTIYFVQADTSRPEGVNTLLEAIDRLTGRVDVLINNAGSAGDPRCDNVDGLSGEAFRRLLNDNLIGPFLVTREVLLRYMLPRQDGVVVFLGTHNGQLGRGVLGQLGYGCAKTALSGLLAVLTAQCGQHVRFHLVRPGITVTQSANWQRRRQLDPGWEDKESRYTPAGELPRPEDVARAIAWLASDEARMVNGVELTVDGGLSASGIVHPAWDAASFRESFVRSVALYQEQEAAAKKAA